VSEFFLNKSPLRNPPNVEAKASIEDCSEVEKIYLSHRKQGRMIEDDELSPFWAGKQTRKQSVNHIRIEEGEREREPRYILFQHDKSVKSYDTGLPSKKDEQIIKQHNINLMGFNVDYGRPSKRGPYRKAAIHRRIENFLDKALADGTLKFSRNIDKRQLRFAIKRLGLARDKLAVTQYIERFLLYRYFSLDSKTGMFQLENITAKKEEHLSHNDLKKLMLQIRGVTVKVRAKKSGCF